MRLPEELSDQIEKLSLNTSLTDLVKTFHGLSDLYRTPRGTHGMDLLASDKQRLSYLHVRLPATFAAIVRVLKELFNRMPDLHISSLADVGAGPGTGLWAALAQIPSLSLVSCYERDRGFIALGKQLASSLQSPRIEWVHKELTENTALKRHDLVLASYALAELPLKELSGVVGRLWEAAGKALIIIEPGTPEGFRVLKEIRSQCLELGAHLIAPCPHAGMCPMGQSDWCHFAARVERSSLHRRIKGGTLNFEDEKFSYLIFAKEPSSKIQGRIIRRPQKNTGFVAFTTCQESGIQQMTVTRKVKEKYRQMRKAEWGDYF
ncbi:MAG: small ribosomal subunit Rsm22 family protein [Rhabdochlamydiaceae bacterium]|nr:small ribosomal subunit Rsm22 family protein [Rhabdochlamydiaceae bacterium]